MSLARPAVGTCAHNEHTHTGLPVKAVVTATALSSMLASLACGLFANLPVGLSPGMGLNAYLVFSQVRVWAVWVCCLREQQRSAVLLRACAHARCMTAAMRPNTLTARATRRLHGTPLRRCWGWMCRCPRRWPAAWWQRAWWPCWRSSAL
jgi:hypothetical protein